MKNRLFGVLVSVSACGGIEEAADDQPPVPESPRVQEGLQALYMFDEGDGLIVHDTSGVEPAFDLQLDNLVTNHWVPDGHGVEVVGSSVITSTEVAEKVFVACVQANAVSLEVWIEPANNTQNGTIYTYTKNNERNVTLGVEQTRYRGDVRTSNPDPLATELDVNNTVQTPENIAAPAVQHLVYTRNQTTATIYVDGTVANPPNPPDPNQPPPPPPPITDQNGWSPAYQLAFGNETDGNRPWLGKIYLAAIYCRDLTGVEVQKNFAAGFAF